MKKLHWNPLPAERVENTVWAAKPGRRQSLQLGEGDIQHMAELFSARPARTKPATARGGGGGAAEGKQKKGKVHLVDFKRGNNVAIGLAQFRRMGFGKVVEAVQSFDREALPAGKAAMLRDLVPTAAELRTVAGYKGDEGDLGPAEQFFRVVGRSRRVGAKVEALISAHQFEEHREELAGKLATLRQACTEVRDSRKLAEFLEAILEIGNVMNAVR